MSPAFRSLGLEVWLGPMEGLKHVAEARSGPQTLRIGRLPFDRQSKERNHLVLSAAAGVSGSHAEVRYVSSRFYLRDLGSSNGTFAQQQAITAEAEVAEGEIFLVSLTPIRIFVTEPLVSPPPFEPVSVATWEDPAWQVVLTLAAEAASRRGERHIDTRHLLDALLRVPDEQLDRSFADSGWSRTQALAELWTKALYTGSQAWLADILGKPVAMSASTAGAVVSPRVSRLLDSARTKVTATVPSARTPQLARRLLAGLLQDPGGPVGAWLLARGLTLERVESSGAAPVPEHARRRDRGHTSDETPPSGIRVSATMTGKGKATTMISPSALSEVHERHPVPPPVPPAPPPVLSEALPSPAAARPPEEEQPEQRRDLGGPPARLEESVRRPVERSAVSAAAAPAAAPAPAGPAWAPRTPLELALEAKAHELAAELADVAAQYRFGTAADRRKAVKARLARELASLPPESRRLLLELVRTRFPVLAAGEPGPAEEVPRLKRKIKELESAREREAAEAPAPARVKGAAPPADAVSVHTLLTGEDLASSDKSAVVLRQTIEYALAMEGMTLGLVQSLTMPGNETVAFRLPNYRETLRSFLTALDQGKAVNTERVHKYLEEVKRWQVALLAAFHQAPTDWFEKLWRRINPSTIESAPRSAGWKLRGEAAEWWDLYKLAVRELGPDVVKDQILQAVARIAREELEKLRKNTSEV